jgi:hypothetical protein
MAEEQMYAATLHKYTALAVEKIKSLVTAGLDASQIGGLNDDGFFGYGRRLRADLINRRERIANFGRGQVNQELKRQSAGGDTGASAD